jgi:hypothetical protein
MENHNFDDGNLLKSFQTNIMKLTSAYEVIKIKLQNFDKHLCHRIDSINVEINKQINNLLNEIEKLNNSLKYDLDCVTSKIKLEKSIIDKNLVEIGDYLSCLAEPANFINIEKLVDYQEMISKIPENLNKSLHSLTFIPTTLNSIGSLSNVKPIENFQFNFSVNYKPVTKALSSINDCAFNKHLIVLEWNSQYFHVIDRSTLNYIKKVPVFDHDCKEVVIKGLCVLDRRRQVCFIDNTSSNIYLLNKKYELVKQIELYGDDGKRCFEAIEFNMDNNLIYILDIARNSIILFDNELNFKSEILIKIPFREFYSFKFKIFKNKIYLNDILNKCYHLFDENVSYVSTLVDDFENSQLILCNNSNYLLIFDKSCIQVYDSVNYVLVKKIIIDNLLTINNAVIIDDIIVFLNDNDLQVFDVK